MSNPVAPPPAGEGFPPPANQGFGNAPAPGQPEPGQPYGDPAQQGFGDNPAAVPAEPKKKSRVGRTILGVVGSLVVFIMILVAKDALFGDKAKDAAVGDCVAASKDVKVDEETKADAEVVDCASADAAFTVAGRVEGESDTKSKSCEKFFKDNEEYFVYASTAGRGYLLCLRPKAA